MKYVSDQVVYFSDQLLERFEENGILEQLIELQREENGLEALVIQWMEQSNKNAIRALEAQRRANDVR